MRSKNRIHLGRFIRHVSVILLVFGALAFLLIEAQHAFAQTGAPPSDPVITPPAGTVVIDPIFPATPPANIPPLVGNGILGVIPQNAENAVAPMNVLFSNGIRATLLVPASDITELVVKIEEIETGGLPASALPVSFMDPLKAFEIAVFDAASGELITVHESPLLFGLALSPGTHPGDLVLLHFNPSTNLYERLEITGDPITGVIKAEMIETSTFALVSLAVSSQPAKTERVETTSDEESRAEIKPTPSTNEAETASLEEETETQTDDGSRSGSLFGSTTEGNSGSQSLFGAPANNDANQSPSSDESEHNSTATDSPSIERADNSVLSSFNKSNHNLLLTGFAVLITSLGIGFGFLGWYFRTDEA